MCLLFLCFCAERSEAHFLMKDKREKSEPNELGKLA